MSDHIVLRNVTKKFTTKTLGDIVAVDNFNIREPLKSEHLKNFVFQKCEL